MAASHAIDFNAFGASHPWLAPLTDALRLIVGLDVISLSWLATLVAAVLMVVSFDRVFNTTSALAHQKFSPTSYAQDVAVIFVQVLLFRLLAGIDIPISWQDLAPQLSAMFFPVAAPDAPGKPLIAAFLLTVFLAGNLCTYLAHRLLHAVPCLWELHKFHHSAESLGVFSGFREHPVAVLLNGLIVVLGTSLVAAPFLAICPGLLRSPDLFTGGLLSFVAFKSVFLLTHFHRPISFGVFDALLVSPAIHAIHHSKDPRHFDKNFGANITLWDIVFGTFHRATPSELAALRYGLHETEAVMAGRLLPLHHLYVVTTWRSLRALRRVRVSAAA